MLRYLVAGFSHGEGLLGILEGLPAGFFIQEDKINFNLQRRQYGFGRSSRMVLEKDKIKIVTGLSKGYTVGGALGLYIENKDFNKRNPRFVPRPGHADLAGALKYGLNDLEDVSEAASARITAMYVALGSIAKILLEEFKIDCLGYVIQIGKIKAKENSSSLKQKRKFLKNSFLNCLDIKAEELMKREIIKARENGDTLGGILKVEAEGVPPGIGSYVQTDRKLNVRLAKALMSIPSVKGVEVGEGFNLTNFAGSEVQDEIYWENGYKRKTNYAGGIEGGISNGEKILLQAVMKPIPTLKSSLNSINIITKEKTPAPYLRSDVCVLPSGSVIAESMLALEIACAFCEKFYADHLDDMRSNYKNYLKRIRF